VRYCCRMFGRMSLPAASILSPNWRAAANQVDGFIAWTNFPIAPCGGGGACIRASSTGRVLGLSGTMTIGALPTITGGGGWYWGSG